MKKYIKIFFYKLLYYTGVVWLWRIAHRNRIIILMVHGVMEKDGKQQWTPLRPQISTEQFEKTIVTLKKRYRFIPLEEGLKMLSGKMPLQPYSMVITFDDGYRNNITHALPILKKYNIPATIFLTTGAIENREPFWFDRLDYVLQKTNVDGLEVRVAEDKQIVLEAKDRETLKRSYKTFRDLAKSKQKDDLRMREQIDTVIEMLEVKSGISYTNIFETDEWGGILTWEEIRNIKEELLTFGSHTVDHIRLGLVDKETAFDQLERSKRMIEKHLGKPCLYICYPNGSYNRETIEIAKACGYMVGLTTIPGTNKVGQDLMELKRVHVPLRATNIEILFHVCGISFFLSQITNFFRRIF